MTFSTALTKTRRLLVGFMVLIALLWLSLSLAYAYSPSEPDEVSFSSQYDRYFQRSAAHYLSEYDWRWLKAQCIQESWLDRYAVSRVGAKGLCQFMDFTWQECQRALGFVASPFDPSYNIQCAGWYMRGRVDVWGGRGRTHEEKLPLGQAAYNCGTGCVLRAQRACDNGRLFPDISPCLPQETREYPPRIEDHYDELLGGR